MTRTIIHSQQADEADPPVSRRCLIITIDGPAGAGKSTVAKRLAKRLGYRYLETGALYRAVAWRVATSGVSPSDPRGVTDLLPVTRITMEPGNGEAKVFVDGKDVSREIRAPEISRIASIVSAVPAVREWLLPLQRQLGAGKSLVAEGRDLGTRIFPGADVKFFLEADVEVRAARRALELKAAGDAAALEQTREAIRARDERDRSRDLAPLVPAPDASVIDTSALDADQVVERMMAVIAKKL